MSILEHMADGFDISGRDQYNYKMVPNSSAVAYIHIVAGDPGSIRDVFIERYWKAWAKTHGFKIRRRYRGWRKSHYTCNDVLKHNAWGAALYVR